MSELNNIYDNSVPEVQSTEHALENNGIAITHVSIEENKLIEQGYDRLPDSALISLNELLQYVPGIVADKATRMASEEATEQMLQDAMRVICKDGMRMGHSRKTPGRYSGDLFTDGRRGITGVVELERIDRIELSKTPQIVLHCFDLLSAVTGQYFMASINNRLSNIEEEVREVLDFLEDDKWSQIQTDQKILNGIASRLESIMSTNVERQAKITQVDQIRRETQHNIDFFYMHLRKALMKKNKISDIVDSICKFIPQYWCSVRVYALSSLLYVLLSDNANPEDFDATWNEVSCVKADYQANYDEFLAWLNALVRKKNAKGGLAAMSFSFLCTVASIPFSILNPSTGVLIRTLGKLPEEITTSIQKSRGENIQEKLERSLIDCCDLSQVDSCMENIEKYKLLQNNGFEILQTKNAAYIKFLKDEEDKLVS